MTSDAVPIEIQHRYPEACIRGPKITRLEERRLEYFRLDAATAWDLGRNNVGVFVGGCDSLDRTIDTLKALDRTSQTSRWVIVASSKDVAALVVQQWFRADSARRVAVTTLKLPQVSSNIVLTTPESLKRISAGDRAAVAGIVLLDLLCHVHKLRGMQRGHFHIANDRPQHVADFRNDIAVGDWLPPLFLLTHPPAKSIETAAIARAYCLDAWWFVDGTSLRCGPQPAISVDLSDTNQ